MQAETDKQYPEKVYTELQANIRICESPRDAMQGIREFIPTERKVEYINSLISAGFDIVDVGSFVSGKAVSQMADTAEVIETLDLAESQSEIMVLVVNEKGAIQAGEFERINYISFPFSISETFLKLNINSTPQKAFTNSLRINEICQKSRKKFICYLAMGLGNPYGDKWHPDIVLEWIRRLRDQGVEHFNISDITSEADAERINLLYSLIFNEFEGIDIGIHLHTKRKFAREKIEAAWYAGVRYFDTVRDGFGGCPMSGYELLGNLDSKELISFCIENGINSKVNYEKLKNIKGFQ